MCLVGHKQEQRRQDTISLLDSYWVLRNLHRRICSLKVGSTDLAEFIVYIEIQEVWEFMYFKLGGIRHLPPLEFIFLSINHICYFQIVWLA